MLCVVYRARRFHNRGNFTFLLCVHEASIFFLLCALEANVFSFLLRCLSRASWVTAVLFLSFSARLMPIYFFPSYRHRPFFFLILIFPRSHTHSLSLVHLHFFSRMLQYNIAARASCEACTKTHAAVFSFTFSCSSSFLYDANTSNTFLISFSPSFYGLY